MLKKVSFKAEYISKLGLSSCIILFMGKLKIKVFLSEEPTKGWMGKKFVMNTIIYSYSFLNCNNYLSFIKNFARIE